MARGSFRQSGTQGTRDDTGLLTVKVPWYAPTEDQALTVGEPPFGLVETDRSWNDVEGLEGFDVEVTYEGFEDGKDEGEETFEFDPSFSEEPIESHPNFLELKEEYGGTLDDNDKVKWPETVTSSNNPLDAQGEEDEKNPLFGVSTYLALKSVFRRTYTRRRLPSDLLGGIGEITDSLPDGFPTPTGRNWLRLPPKVSRRGNAYQISEEFLLSPVGGLWPEGVHGLIET